MTDGSDLLRRLGQVPLFRRCRERDLKAIVSTARERTYPAGKTIIEQGQEGVAFYLVLDGEVEVRKGDRTVATLRSGDYFGELALLSHEPQRRNATVVAVTETRCLLLTVWDFRALLEGSADLATQILAGVAERLREHETSDL